MNSNGRPSTCFVRSSTVVLIHGSCRPRGAGDKSQDRMAWRPTSHPLAAAEGRAAPLGPPPPVPRGDATKLPPPPPRVRNAHGAERTKGDPTPSHSHRHSRGGAQGRVGACVLVEATCAVRQRNSRRTPGAGALLRHGPVTRGARHTDVLELWK